MLAADPATRPDLISINLGHIALWERPVGGAGRRTVHFPNGYEDVAALLAACEEHGIAPELGVMDLGFVSNSVALRDDGLLPGRPWFLVELDSPAYGAGPQVAPSTVDNYRAIAGALRAHVPGAAWAAHGNGVHGYAVARQALAEGAHVRVGFEDAVHLPEGRLARSNAELVEWAVRVAQDRGREPATIAEARGLIGLNAV
jgi:3-keto-5-aminohexanoate cleavage enzyme